MLANYLSIAEPTCTLFFLVDIPGAISTAVTTDLETVTVRSADASLVGSYVLTVTP